MANRGTSGGMALRLLSRGHYAGFRIGAHDETSTFTRLMKVFSDPVPVALSNRLWRAPQVKSWQNRRKKSNVGQGAEADLRGVTP